MHMCVHGMFCSSYLVLLRHRLSCNPKWPRIPTVFKDDLEFLMHLPTARVLALAAVPSFGTCFVKSMLHMNMLTHRT